MPEKLPPIQNQHLLFQALSHRSYINEHPEAGSHNERLEFLGDAVLGFLVGEFLFRRYPAMSEAQLTRLRSILVDEQQLAKFARKLDLGRLMKLGKGADKEGGRKQASLLSNTFEAVIAAYFLDAGVEAVRDFLEPLLLSTAENFLAVRSQNELERESLPQLKYLVDSKNRFQQWALAQFGETPQYSIIEESGPDHAKEFTAEVRVNGRRYGIGKDRRKQEAEKRAAEAALSVLGLN